MKSTQFYGLLLSTTLLVTAGCTSEDEETVTPFNWTISESNAKNIVNKLLSYEDGETNATNAITADTNTGLKTQNAKFFTTPTPLPCDKSGTFNSTFTGDLFSDFNWTMTFASCNSNDGAGPVNGTMVISSASNSITGDITGMIDLNLTSQGFTISGDIDSTTYADSSTETSFALSVASSTGTLSAATNPNFITYAGDLHPSTGAMTVTGPLGNKIIVTAMGADVQIEVDIGGDGTIESTEVIAWTAL